MKKRLTRDTDHVTKINRGDYSDFTKEMEARKTRAYNRRKREDMAIIAAIIATVFAIVLAFVVVLFTVTYPAV